MLATKHFTITKGRQDDWFDTILDADTELFVDPFLIFQERDGFWADAHDALIRHFDQAFILIAEGNLNPASIQYKKALALLHFKEPRELCLGYTAEGTAGLGSGQTFAGRIGGAIADAIKRGLEHPRHFEELGILNEGIGADRISDITCTILKSKLITYTQEIAHRLQIPLEAHSLYAGSFDEQRKRWATPEVQVPTNPSAGGPLLFVPERFLRRLPVLNANDWWSDWENEKLRQDVNYEIMRHVDKATIVATARANPASVREWTIRKEGSAAPAYDFEADPNGVWKWDAAADTFATNNPLTIAPPGTQEEFFKVIDMVIGMFRLFIEEQGGWYLLWRDRRGIKDKEELAAQLVFRGIAQSYCRANDISLDAEVNLGRGPVDFKFSNGYRRRAHLEVKKLHNGKFWNGLERQLPSYLGSDQVRDGWFLAIRYKDNKLSKDRASELPARMRRLAEAKQLNLRYALVDARPRESASKL